jgi:hypothetical protein
VNNRLNTQYITPIFKFCALSKPFWYHSIKWKLFKTTAPRFSVWYAKSRRELKNQQSFPGRVKLVPITGNNEKKTTNGANPGNVMTQIILLLHI